MVLIRTLRNDSEGKIDCCSDLSSKCLNDVTILIIEDRICCFCKMRNHRDGCFRRQFCYSKLAVCEVYFVISDIPSGKHFSFLRWSIRLIKDLARLRNDLNSVRSCSILEGVSHTFRIAIIDYYIDREAVCLELCHAVGGLCQIHYLCIIALYVDYAEVLICVKGRGSQFDADFLLRLHLFAVGIESDVNSSEVVDLSHRLFYGISNLRLAHRCDLHLGALWECARDCVDLNAYGVGLTCEGKRLLVEAILILDEFLFRLLDRLFGHLVCRLSIGRCLVLNI